MTPKVPPPGIHLRLVCKSVEAAKFDLFRVGFAGSLDSAEALIVMVDDAKPEALPRVGRWHDLAITPVED